MQLIVGLGNPGSQYERTRHNIGFVLLDMLAAELGVNFGSSKWQAMTAKGSMAGQQVMLVKPQTFMNLSGEAVAPIVSYFNVEISDIIVVHDELDLTCGQLKLATNRGPGGHNGLKSINKLLGSRGYNRLRFGIGRPMGQMPIERHVLSRFSAEEEQLVASSLELALDALYLMVAEGMAKAMQKIHSA